MMIGRPAFLAGPEEFVNLQGLLIQSSNGLHQFSKVQFPIHQFDWKVRSVLDTVAMRLRSVQFIHFISGTFLQGCVAGVGAGAARAGTFRPEL